MHPSAVALATAPWTTHDTRLMLVAVIGIAVIVLLIVLAKMHAFLALGIGSVFVGLASGVSAAKVITNFEAGVGSTLQEVGLLIALGASSLFLSHVNDAGFWLVKESFGLTVGQTFKSWSMMETAVSVVGFGFVMLLSAFV